MRTIYRSSHEIPLFRLDDGQYITMTEAHQMADLDQAVILDEMSQQRFAELYDKHSVRKPFLGLDKVGGSL